MRPTLVVLLALSFVAVPGCLDFVRNTLNGFSGNEPADYVTDEKYTRWIIEIDHVQGLAPSTAAIDLLESRMASLVAKDSVEVVVDGVITGGNSPWSADELKALADEHQDHETSGDTVVTYVAYVDGRYTNENALGVAVNHDIVGMFPETIDASCTPSNLCFFNEQKIEQAVIIHEFGHIVGLVNRGVDMVNDHEDDQHRGHSDNQDSVMYWAVDSSVGLPGLDRVPTEFDAEDKRDICNAGGKC